MKDVRLDAWQWVAILFSTWAGSLVFAALGVAIGYVATADVARPISMLCYFVLAMLGGLWVPITTFPMGPGHRRAGCPAAVRGARPVDRVGQAPHAKDIGLLSATCCSSPARPPGCTARTPGRREAHERAGREESGHGDTRHGDAPGPTTRCPGRCPEQRPGDGVPASGGRTAPTTCPSSERPADPQAGAHQADMGRDLAAVPRRSPVSDLGPAATPRPSSPGRARAGRLRRDLPRPGLPPHPLAAAEPGSTGRAGRADLLAAVLSFIAGEDWLVLFVYLAVACGAALPGRQALLRWWHRAPRAAGPASGPATLVGRCTRRWSSPPLLGGFGMMGVKQRSAQCVSCARPGPRWRTWRPPRSGCGWPATCTTCSATPSR